MYVCTRPGEVQLLHALHGPGNIYIYIYVYIDILILYLYQRIPRIVPSSPSRGRAPIMYPFCKTWLHCYAT